MVAACKSCTQPHDLTYMLQPVCRLPRLYKLQLSIAEQEASQLYGIAYLLQLVGVQMPQLRCLELDPISSSWADSSWPWEALGSATQLTRLAVRFPGGVRNGFRLQHLSALSSLSSLQCLDIGVWSLQRRQEYTFLSTLPASLTLLKLPLAEGHEGFSCVALCTQLQRLVLVNYGSPVLSAAEYAAIGSLVQLTCLDMRGVDNAGGHPEFLSSLQSLEKLERLGVDGLSAASLPSLAGLTSLHFILGAWQQSSYVQQGQQQHMCQHVTQLAGRGSIPLAAFPNLKGHIHQLLCPPAFLTSLAAHCMQLQALQVELDSAVVPLTQRTAAIANLAKLRHLTSISFTVREDAEFAALATVKQLRQLTVTVHGSSSCTPMGLQMLMQLTGLQDLRLTLQGMTFSEHEAQMVLCGMQHVRRVFISTNREQIEVFQAALQAASAAQLRTPAELKLKPQA